MKKLTLAAVLCVALFSCKKTDINSNKSSESVLLPVDGGRTGGEGGFCGEMTTVNLMAGQSMLAGNVTVSNDADSIYVTYNTTGDWKLKEIHLYVGPYNEAPLSGGGNPAPGKFDYKAAFTPQVTTYTVSISLAEMDPCYIVAAHSVVVNSTNGAGTQTGWGQGVQFPGNNWGMYFNYCTQNCD